MTDPSDNSEKPINLLLCAIMVQTLQRVAMRLPPIDKVLEALDTKELSEECAGRDIPREALKGLRPIFLAAREFQNACRAQERQLQAEEARPQSFAVNFDGGLC